MPNPTIEKIITEATQRAFADWAREHPSLAAVIDPIVLTDRTVERLRDTEEYHRAVAGYYQGRHELDLFTQILDLATTMLPLVLAM